MLLMTQVILNSLIIGSIYSLVAAGFSLIYSVCRFINFAHGGIITIAGYLFFLFYLSIGINFTISVILTLLLSSMAGYLTNKIFFRSLKKRNASSAVLLISSLAILVLIESTIHLFFGSDYKTIKYTETNVGHEILGGYITNLQIIIILISLCLFIILFWLIKYTKLGKAFRAVADNRILSEIIGISMEKIYTHAFLVASLIAGIAGIMISLEQGIFPLLGSKYIVVGLTAAIIGGIGNIYGAVLGSLLLGLFENIGVSILPSAYKELVVFFLLLLFLLLRPQGVLGIRKNILDV
jgi:branched-subunit amino acid ABC-type transport system permease component